MCITVKEMNEKMQEIQSLKRKLNRILQHLKEK